MLFDPKHGQYLGTLEAELRRARSLTPELMSEVMAQACGRFAPHEEAATRGITRLIEAGACVDAVLALIASELPQWTLRRVLYEDGDGIARSRVNRSCRLSSMRSRRAATKPFRWQF